MLPNSKLLVLGSAVCPDIIGFNLFKITVRLQVAPKIRSKISSKISSNILRSNLAQPKIGAQLKVEDRLKLSTRFSPKVLAIPSEQSVQHRLPT